MADTSSSSSFRVRGDGTTEAVFVGGVELPITLDGASDGSNTVRWVLANDSTEVGRIEGFQETEPVDGFRVSGVRLTGGVDTDAAIALYSNTAGSNISRVDATAGGHTVLVIGSFGDSDFLLKTDGPFVEGDAEDFMPADAGPFPTGTNGYGEAYLDADGTAEGVIAHGLGFTPTTGIAQGRFGGALFFNVIPLGMAAADAGYATFAFQLNTDDPSGFAGQLLSFTWVVFA